MAKHAITPLRKDDFPEWYQSVVKEAKLAEKSLTRGSMIILPQGMALWERMRDFLDKEFKNTGHENVYFPLLIPLNLMQQEADHVEGFAKECAVVTHRRLETDSEGKLIPAGELNECYIIRPTSEMVIGEAFSRWVNSYRDLPIKINQWANVMRWEMRPRVFLRTSEFLWQEGHTVHQTAEEALEETKQMLEVYADFMHQKLAMPVIKGEKSESEKFPGAEITMTVEAMMQDGKALQAGTSHFLGQNFSRAQNIQFFDKDETQKFAWTTSWGVSTRMVGGLIMTHADDDGMIMPPELAPYHLAIIPMLQQKDHQKEILEFCHNILEKVDTNVRVRILDDERKASTKKWEEIKKGTPIILEVGNRDVEKGNAFFLNRITMEKSSLPVEEFISKLPSILSIGQNFLLQKSLAQLQENITVVESAEELEKFFSTEQFGFAYAPIHDNEKTIEILKSHKATIRCYPFKQGLITDEYVDKKAHCLLCNEPNSRYAIIAKSY